MLTAAAHHVRGLVVSVDILGANGRVGFDTPLPSFDQNQAIATAGADERSWTSHLEEFRAVRAATLTFFQNLPKDAWTRRGIASDNPFTVRALAYIAAGHVTHHIKIVRDRYMV